MGPKGRQGNGFWSFPIVDKSQEMVCSRGRLRGS
ncbi:hypothetical protein AMTRI_Chr10g2100 [Amborella trichopoda]